MLFYVRISTMTRLQFEAPSKITTESSSSTNQQNVDSQADGSKRLLMQWQIAVAITCILLAICLLIIGIMLLIWADTPKQPNKVLLVSYDGFRWDYIQQNLKNLPTYQQLISTGVWSKYGMRNAFATKTAPNHYVMATGLYEESNGIVGNDFWDPKLGRFDYWSKLSKTDPRFFLGEPIWVTNQLAGKQTGCVMWHGCDVNIKGQRSTNYISLNESMPWDQRLDRIIQWLNEPSVALGLLYIEQPDLYGHKYGPGSQEIKSMVVQMDKFTSQIMQKLKDNKMLEKTNVILTSDHGMTATPLNNSVNLDNYLNKGWIQAAYGGSPNMNILPKQGFTDKIVESLRNVEHISVYKKDEIPAQYHYHNSDRILPVQVFADMHWRLVSSLLDDDIGRSNGLPIDRVNLGDHGYNNSEPDMHPYFVAIGPDFKQGYTKESSFENVDLYPLMCHLLDIKPAPSNGTLSRVKDMLNEDQLYYGSVLKFYYTQAMVLTSMVLMCVGFVQALLLYMWVKRQSK